MLSCDLEQPAFFLPNSALIAILKTYKGQTPSWPCSVLRVEGHALSWPQEPPLPGTAVQASNGTACAGLFVICRRHYDPHAAWITADSRIASQARQTDSTSIASMYLLEARRRCRVPPGQTAFCTTRCCEP
jgi:hypothetical protein